MNISAIAAVDKNFGLGYQNKLLFRIKQDMQFFKETTIGNTVIMGRKTFESMGSKPLKDRDNIVITSDISKHTLKDNLRITSMDIVENMLKNDKSNKRYFIIGGGSIYEQLLKYCDSLYLTVFNKEYDDVDTWFPNPLKHDFHQAMIIEADFVDFVPYVISLWLRGDQYRNFNKQSFN